nr:hypothetical protein [Micromonospora sp. DSM 115978]
MDIAKRTSPCWETPPSDLWVALGTAASIQTIIRRADAKAAALLAMAGAVGAAAVEPLVPIFLRDGWIRLAGAVLLISLLSGLAVATWHLRSAIWPRLVALPGTNRFSFPNLARDGGCPPGCTALTCRDEAWEFASTLAGIAMAKHLRVRRSGPWLVVAAVSTVCVVLLKIYAATVAP